MSVRMKFYENRVRLFSPARESALLRVARRLHLGGTDNPAIAGNRGERMRMDWRTMALVAGVVCSSATAAVAGGAWVPDKGDGDFQFGTSRKVAHYSWNPEGRTVKNSSWHLFRYGYQGTEYGLGHKTSFYYTVLYLDGLEGPPGAYEQNRGMSELFLGFKRQVHRGKWPMAVSFDMRTSILYDQAGTYNRHDFLPDPNGQAVLDGVDSEWRGLLGEDYGLKFRISRSVFETGWLNFDIGYTYRTGNLADEMPFNAEIGYPLHWDWLFIKGTFNWVDSVGNNSLKRQPDDRFGCSPNNCFPDASRQVIGAGLMFNIGQQRLWWVEAGFNHWLWGHSTRKYEEPYLSLGRKF